MRTQSWGYVPLEALPSGAKAKVVIVMAPGSWSQRLLQMGFVPGAIVEVLYNNRPGPIIVRVMNTTISLGRGIARRIFVEPIVEGETS
mgnify:CR=1 FL=1